MIVVTAKIRAKEEHADEVAALFAGMVEWIKDNEASTLTYACNRATNDRSQFLFFERYADQASLDAHSKSERFGELIVALSGKLDGGIDLETYEEVAAKL